MTAPAPLPGPPHYRAYRVVLAIMVITMVSLILLWLLAMALDGPALEFAISPEEWY